MQACATAQLSRFHSPHDDQTASASHVRLKLGFPFSFCVSVLIIWLRLLDSALKHVTGSEVYIPSPPWLTLVDMTTGFEVSSTHLFELTCMCMYVLLEVEPKASCILEKLYH